jgi:chromosome transmission fidelity protein 1
VKIVSAEVDKDDWFSLFNSNDTKISCFDDDKNHQKNFKNAIDRSDAIQKRINQAKYQDINIKKNYHPFSKEKTKISVLINGENSKDESDKEYDEFILEEYNSDADEIQKNENSDDDDENSSDDEFPKILYCSRTHSQISQFVNEIKKTVYKDVKCITLGSRRTTCINTNINTSLTSDNIISDKCLDMQKSKSKQSTQPKKQRTKKSLMLSPGPCSYHTRTAEESFVDHALGNICDIEDLTTLGKRLGYLFVLYNLYVTCIRYHAS